MQNATILTTENQVNVNVVTSANRKKDFSFGETNEMHVIQEDDNKQVINSALHVDGLGVNDSSFHFTSQAGTVRAEMTPTGEIRVYKNDVLEFEML